METLFRDLRLAMRTLLKAPAFTAVSLIALALGIGANTVMFSVVNTVLLRALAYRDPQRLMVVQTVQQDTNTPISNSPPDFYRLRAESRAFEAVSGLYRRPVNLTGAYEPERIRAIVASAPRTSSGARTGSPSSATACGVRGSAPTRPWSGAPSGSTRSLTRSSGSCRRGFPG